MSCPYEKGILNKSDFAKVKRRRLRGEIVAVLSRKLDNRGLDLITSMTRVVLQNEIHELILTDEQSAGPGKNVDGVAYIGFFEVKTGGLVVVGDQISVDGKFIGEVVGFDETHSPNHLNIVMQARERRTGLEFNLELGDEVIIEVNRRAH